MARSKARVIELDDDSGDHPMLGRFLLWAGLAAVAMGFAALAAQTRTGAQRIAALLDNDGSSTTVAIRSEALAGSTRPTEADLESRRVAEQVRQLTADRDRLLARIDALERNVEVTGSLPREALREAPREAPAPAKPSAPTASPPTPPLGWSLVPNNIPPAAGIPSAPMPNNGGAPPQSSGSPANAAPGGAAPSGANSVTASEQAAGSIATRTEFAVDLGGDASFDGLRAMWSSLRNNHAALLEGLRPVAAVREGSKPGSLELRLVVGPLHNAVAAARLCASLGAAGVTCQATIFDGQRFALR
jgi:hypothetical protein